MLKSVWVCVQRAEKIGVLNHGEQGTPGNGNYDGLFDTQSDRERLQINSCQVIPRKTPLLSVEL